MTHTGTKSMAARFEAAAPSIAGSGYLAPNAILAIGRAADWSSHATSAVVAA